MADVGLDTIQLVGSVCQVDADGNLLRLLASGMAVGGFIHCPCEVDAVEVKH